MKEKRWQVVLVISGIVAILLLLLGVEQSGLIRINRSKSIPKGVYLRISLASITLGDYLLFTLPKEEYFPQNQVAWYPKDNQFMKQVVGVEGDRIFHYANGFLVGDTTLYPRYPYDRMGVTLPNRLGSHHRVPVDSFVVGSTLAESYDSRYFGPVGVPSIIRQYRLIWEW